MAEYRSGEDIAKEYAVGEARLFAFARRGNLPMRLDDGVRFYDVSVVSRLFRRRDAQELAGPVLGGFRLGDTLSGERAPAAHSERRASVRVPRVPGLVELPVRKHNVA